MKITDIVIVKILSYIIGWIFETAITLIIGIKWGFTLLFQYLYYISAFVVIIAILYIIFNAKMMYNNPVSLFVSFFGMILNPIISLILNLYYVILYLLEFPLHIYNTIKSFVLILVNIITKIISFITYISSFVFYEIDEIFR